MTVESVVQELDAAKQAYQDAIERIKGSGAGNLFKEFFEQNPNVYALQWAQYTPYFNDGDPCTFSVGDVAMALRPLTEDSDIWNGYPADYEESEGNEKTWFDSYELARCRDWKADPKVYDLTAEFIAAGGTQELYDSYKAVNKFVAGQQDLMEALFGDHVVVRATPTDIVTEEYEHD